MRVCRILLLAACAVGGCSSPTTSVVLRVTYEERWALTSLEVEAGGHRGTSPVVTELRVLLPDEWAGQEVTLRVWGLRAAARFAHGSVTVRPLLGAAVEAQVALARLPCGAWCTAGATRCVGDGVAVCEERDDDQCFEWSEPVACPVEAPFCSHGVCGSTCVDECAAGERRCDGPFAVRACGQADSDACRDWLPSTPCPEGEICSNGVCAAQCQDECAGPGCLGGALVGCDDLNGDGCVEWGPPTPCPEGTSCSGGACQASCVDECTTDGCDGLTFYDCGQYDFDPCRDRSPGVSCASTDPCVEGRCEPTGCATAAKVCLDPPAAICLDASTRRVYSGPGTCRPEDGTCDYPYTDINCPSCPACDPCASVTCLVAPEPTCLSSTTLRTYTAPGTCSGGQCTYPYTDTTCPVQCSNGACVSTPPECSASQCGERDCGVMANLHCDCGPCKTDATWCQLNCDGARCVNNYCCLPLGSHCDPMQDYLFRQCCPGTYCLSGTCSY